MREADQNMLKRRGKHQKYMKKIHSKQDKSSQFRKFEECKNKCS